MQKDEGKISNIFRLLSGTSKPLLKGLILIELQYADQYNVIFEEIPLL